MKITEVYAGANGQLEYLCTQFKYHFNELNSSYVANSVLMWALYGYGLYGLITLKVGQHAMRISYLRVQCLTWFAYGEGTLPWALTSPGTIAQRAV